LPCVANTGQSMRGAEDVDDRGAATPLGLDPGFAVGIGAVGIVECGAQAGAPVAERIDAEPALRQARLDRHREAQRGGERRHGLPRAQEGTRDEVVRRQRRQRVGQDARLLEAACAQRRLRIGAGRFTVANQQQAADHSSSRTAATTPSASMPWMRSNSA
jgi:hypothetical protein